MKGLLKRTLIKVDTASGGKQALELTKEKTYDLIFMDHMMPEMDGVEALHLLRKDMSNPNHDATVIALTAAERDMKINSEGFSHWGTSFLLLLGSIIAYRCFLCNADGGEISGLHSCSAGPISFVRKKWGKERS